MVTGVGLLAAMAYVYWSNPQWLWAGYDLRSFTLFERLLTEGRVLWFYLGLIVFPQLEHLGLYHDDIAISTGLFTPWTTLPALVGLAWLAFLSWWTRTRAPLVSFGIAWFLIGHAMESTVLPLEIAHEHRNYLPLLGILLAAAWVLLRALENKGARKTTGIALAIGAPIFLLSPHCVQTSSARRCGARRLRHNITANRPTPSIRRDLPWQGCRNRLLRNHQFMRSRGLTLNWPANPPCMSSPD